ncbi:MAG: LytTR family DNA-binding domain-containing protein [Cyclobacteriaceae bacterium]
MKTYTVLVVDDEPHARRFLSALLEKNDAFHLLGECANGREAINFCKTQVPDIIFLDIQMPGMTGIEVAYQLRKTESLVIFSTAYDQYAIQAFEVEALDYLIKPYTDKRFNEVLKRAKEMIDLNQRRAFSQRVERLFQSFNRSSSPSLTEIIILNKGLEERIPVTDILYIESSSVYVIIHTKRKQFIYRTTLELLTTQLPKGFMRIHRSFIINDAFVRRSKYLNNNTFSFEMANDKVLKSSRTYKKAVAEFLGSNN